MPLTKKMFEEFSRTKFYIDQSKKEVSIEPDYLKLTKPKSVTSSYPDSDLAVNIVGKAIIYSGNSFSSSSCIPCGNYCSDFN